MGCPSLTYHPELSASRKEPACEKSDHANFLGLWKKSAGPEKSYKYYPFGLQTSASWTRESTTGNQYLYNAANELNKTSGWYEMYFRGYDPAIGRMLQIDPFAALFASKTTYNYALNNPVMMNDPSGGLTSAVGYTDSQLHTMYRLNRIYNGGPADFGDWASDNLDGFGMGDREINGGNGRTYGFDGSGNFGRWATFEYQVYAGGIAVLGWSWTEREFITDPERTAAVAAARTKIGTPYGTDPGEIDCSALVDLGTSSAGIKTKQGNGVGKWNNGVALIVGNSRKVSADKIRVGDLATFKSGRSDHKGKDGEFDHIGIISKVGYVDGKVAGFLMLHAGGSGVKEVYVDLANGLAGYELKNFYQWDSPDVGTTSNSANNSATISQGPSSFGHWLINNSTSGTGLSKLGYFLLNNGL